MAVTLNTTTHTLRALASSGKTASSPACSDPVTSGPRSLMWNGIRCGPDWFGDPKSTSGPARPRTSPVETVPGGLIWRGAQSQTNRRARGEARGHPDLRRLLFSTRHFFEEQGNGASLNGGVCYWKVWIGSLQILNSSVHLLRRHHIVDQHQSENQLTHRQRFLVTISDSSV